MRLALTVFSFAKYSFVDSHELKCIPNIDFHGGVSEASEKLCGRLSRLMSDMSMESTVLYVKSPSPGKVGKLKKNSFVKVWVLQVCSRLFVSMPYDGNSVFIDNSEFNMFRALFLHLVVWMSFLVARKSGSINSSITIWISSAPGCWQKNHRYRPNISFLNNDEKFGRP